MTVRAPLEKEVGILITCWRNRNRISLLDAAARIGTSEKTLMEWERDGSIPAADLLLLLDAYGLGPEVVAASFRHILAKVTRLNGE